MATITAHKSFFGLFTRFHSDDKDVDMVLQTQYINGFIIGTLVTEIVVISCMIGTVYFRR